MILYCYIKRILDILIALLGLIILFPLFTFVIFIIKLESNGPVFFKQLRPGRNGRLFRIYKFRTMNEMKDKNGNLLPNEERLTKIGRFLRKLSLDELPELWNVMKDEMSLVGPRPLRVEYLDKYSPEQARRHEIKSGITGWAQVNGRNAITWEEKFKYDVWYVDHLSFSVDLKIILLTIKKVLFREDINKSEKISMEPFRGSGKLI